MESATLPATRHSLQRSEPHPASGYEEALEKFAALRAREGPEINPLCRSRLLTHGHLADRSVVMLHGIPNCPQQYAQFLPLFFEREYNVLVPRLPYCGLSDLNTRALGRLTAETMRAFTDEVVDIAAGLGRQVTVVGLSAGGTLAAWSAQFREDVARVAVLAPLLGVPVRPRALQPLVGPVARTLPNIFFKRSAKAAAISPPYIYAGQSSRSIGQMLRLASTVMRAARGAPPAARHVRVVMSAADTVVDNLAIQRLLASWQARAADRVEVYEFAIEHQVVHDMIDPLRKDQRVDYVYPLLMDFITREPRS